MRRLWLLLLCLVAPHAFGGAPAGAWWNTSFAYRQQISIPAGASTLPANYAVSVVFDHAAQISAGRSLANGDDVRVVRWNTANSTWVELDRIVDPDTSWNSNATRLWFKTAGSITSGASDDNYYIYFSNGGAGVPPQNADSIFWLFDDFSSGTISNARWDANNGVQNDNGTMRLSPNSRVESRDTFGVDSIWETRALLTASRGDFVYWRARAQIWFLVWLYPELSFQADGAGHQVTTRSILATTTSIAPPNPTAYQNYSFTREGADFARFLINGSQVAAISTNTPSSDLHIDLENNESGRQIYYDWMRVRPYRNPDPTLSLGAAEAHVVPMPSPLGEWRFDQGSWNGVANEVVNSASNAYHGVASGGAQTQVSTPLPARNGNPGTCRYGAFDGNNDYVQIAHNPALSLSSQVTVSAWVYPRSYPSSDLKTIVSKDTNYEFHLNPSGHVYWWWSASTLTSSSAVPLNQWSHIAITYRSGAQRIYINGVLRGSSSFNGNMPTNADPLYIGRDLTGRNWDGYIDEVRVYGTALSEAQVVAMYNSTHVCPITAVADHFAIGHDRTGFACAAETMTVNVRDAANLPYSSYAQQVTLDTQTGRGTWSLISGGGTFNDSTANDGVATYKWPGNQDVATFALSYPEGQRTFDIDVYQSSNIALRDDDSEGTMTFSNSGFVLTSAAAPDSMNPPFPTFATPQIAGTAFPMHIARYGSVANSASCRLVKDYAGAKNIDVWTTYTNPNTQRTTVRVIPDETPTDGAAPNGPPRDVGASATTVPLTFVGGRARVDAKFKDVGLISLNVRDQYEAGLTPPVLTVGSTSGFVVKPSTFTLTTSIGGNLHAGANNENGPVFAKAGEPFTLTVTARDSEDDATPSYGQESTPEGVVLQQTLVGPSGGQNPAISHATISGFSNGIATVSNATWNEVGIINLTPRIADGDYLGGGNTIGTSRNVGRFVPASFAVAKNSPEFAPGCSQFTYVGQPFRYATVKPVFTLTPLSVGGVALQNYRGAFIKLTNATVTDRKYSARLGATDITNRLEIPDLPTVDPTIAGQANGTITLTFDAGARGFFFTRTTPEAEFRPALRLDVNVRDADNVLPVDGTQIESFDPIPFQGNYDALRYGRLAFQNAIGSELLKLAVPMRTEYYASDAVGFVPSTADSCTSGVQLALSDFTGELGASETCALDSGAPGASAIGCAAPAAATQRFRSTASAGDFNLILQAPGSGNGGSVTIRPKAGTVPSWLQFDWDASPSTVQDPSALATFGVFQGISPRRIYQREDTVR